MSNAKKKNGKTKYDSLASSTMSLGDHIEELRLRMILALVGLAMGATVCLFFGRRIIKFIERPYFEAIRARVQDFETARAEPNSMEFTQLLWTNILQALISDPNAPYIDPNHIEFIQSIYNETDKVWQNKQSADTINQANNPLDSMYRLQTLAPADAFLAYMKISLISGLLLSCPWVFYQLWMFVAAGLYPKEKRYVYKAVPFSAILFIIGALFFLLVVAPISLRFFLKFGDLISIQNNWTLQKYMSFVTVLMLVFGAAFQTPIAIFFLNRTGLVSLDALRKSRKYVLVLVFIVGAMATPPDVISQITLAIPLYMLFELGIILSQLSNQEKKETDKMKK